MKAVYVNSPSQDRPLDALEFGERPDPLPPEPDWAVVGVRAASLNHHDLWMLRGIGTSACRYPLILGCEGAGLDENGDSVIVGGLLCAPHWRDEPMRDPARTTLGEGAPGTFAESVAVPRHLLTPLPAGWSYAEGSCLWGTWLPAYRMLFTKAGLGDGDTVLVQGAGGGLSTALIRLAAAAGIRVWVTGRSQAKRDFALSIGAHQAFPAGAPLPEPVDAVMESVGAATWAHSVRSVRPAGTIVVGGATTGGAPPAHLARIFWQELVVLGSAAGTEGEMAGLLRFMELHDLRPEIDMEIPFSNSAEGFRRMLESEVTGKIVFCW